MDINIKQLEVLVAAVECGSFTEAANRLFMAQSTVSGHIKALEEELGVLLFRRESKKHIQLTPEGKRAYNYARNIVARCAALEKDLSQNLQEELVIGTSSLPARRFMPSLLSAFHEKFPDCVCVVKGGTSEQIRQMLLDGVIQVGFVGDADNLSILRYDRIAVDHLVIIAPNTPHYAELQEQGLYGRDLLRAQSPIILRDGGSATRLTVDNYITGIGLNEKDLNIAARVYDPVLVEDLVIRGVGISIVSDSMVQSLVEDRKVLQFELDRQPVRRDIYMVQKKKGTMSEFAKEFVQYVLDRRDMAFPE